MILDYAISYFQFCNQMIVQLSCMAFDCVVPGKLSSYGHEAWFLNFWKQVSGQDKPSPSSSAITSSSNISHKSRSQFVPGYSSDLSQFPNRLSASCRFSAYPENHLEGDFPYFPLFLYLLCQLCYNIVYFYFTRLFPHQFNKFFFCFIQRLFTLVQLTNLMGMDHIWVTTITNTVSDIVGQLWIALTILDHAAMKRVIQYTILLTNF